MALKKIDYFGRIFNISYEILNQSANQNIIFLHGWGSNKELMKQAFGTFCSDFKHIYIDMPGFGKSSNNYILTTKDYANIIDIFLQHIAIDKKSIIIGHSFGGKVATLLNPSNLILLSSAGIIEKKPLKIKCKIAMAKSLRLLGLSQITKRFRSDDVANMSENMYRTFKNVVDEDFSSIFKKFKNNAIIFWGREDKAVSVESGKKIESLVKNSKLYILDGDHYFFLYNSKEICNTINSLVIL